MSLWHYFPDFLAMFDGIVKLPFLMLLLYIYIIYATVKQRQERRALMVFLVLTLISSVFMFKSVGPQGDRIIPPLGLLIVILMPLTQLIGSLYKRYYRMVAIWLLATIAALFHCICWSIVMFAVGGS